MPMHMTTQERIALARERARAVALRKLLARESPPKWTPPRKRYERTPQATAARIIANVQRRYTRNNFKDWTDDDDFNIRKSPVKKASPVKSPVRKSPVRKSPAKKKTHVTRASLSKTKDGKVKKRPVMSKLGQSFILK